MRPCPESRNLPDLLEFWQVATNQQVFLYLGVCYVFSLPYCVALKGRFIGPLMAVTAACSPMGPLLVIVTIVNALENLCIKVGLKKGPDPAIWESKPGKGKP